ncbi:MAG: hypothetical protein MHPSP_004580, partial [Paramarteilia canceri]
QHTDISYACYARRFLASSADFNTIDLINKEIGCLGTEACDNINKIANLYQTAQICYEELQKIKKINALNSKPNIDKNISKPELEKISFLKHIENKLTMIIATGLQLSNENISQDLIDIYWYLSCRSGKIYNQNNRQQALYRCREEIIALKSNKEIDNYLFETNCAKFYRILKDKISLGNQNQGNANSQDINITKPSFLTLPDAEKEDLCKFWGNMWSVSSGPTDSFSHSNPTESSEKLFTASKDSLVKLTMIKMNLPPP